MTGGHSLASLRRGWLRKGGGPSLGVGRGRFSDKAHYQKPAARAGSGQLAIWDITLQWEDGLGQGSFLVVLLTVGR